MQMLRKGRKWMAWKWNFVGNRIGGIRVIDGRALQPIDYSGRDRREGWGWKGPLWRSIMASSKCMAKKCVVRVVVRSGSFVNQVSTNRVLWEKLLQSIRWNRIDKCVKICEIQRPCMAVWASLTCEQQFQRWRMRGWPWNRQKLRNLCTCVCL